ncbi:MAG TPA: serine/threonine-protein kinase [Acidobacteriota bacterium]|nr:serine/threonine-protein kinase [Acidobacteriota bacterium]
MQIDSKLNHYRIVSKIGEGGMGQVFRAVDETLKREVAIKVLPPGLAQNPERLARLEREAQVLAQVEHANIASIYGLEEATPEDGGSPLRLLVMQLAEGETLAARIDQGAVPVEEALAIALQIARALETAHEHGIVHRDLKPANVVLSTSGDIKLLDFGLAKAFAADSMLSSSLQVSASPTVLEATQAGMIMGTAGYMSPEQARGKPVDRRADIWAFGAVLYEMLTGDRAFGGETATDVLGAIVHREPDWQALPPDTPRRIRALLQRCLRKDVDRRIQSIGDARVSIEEYLEDPVAAEAILDAGTVPSAPTGWMRFAPWGVAALLGLMWVADLRPHAAVESTAATLRMEMTLSVDEPLFSSARSGSSMALSPNGEYVAVATGTTGTTRAGSTMWPLARLPPTAPTSRSSRPTRSGSATSPTRRC